MVMSRRTVMATDVGSIGFAWDRYPITAAHADAEHWLRSCAMLGLARNTIAAYARALEIFLGFCQSHSLEARCVTREIIARYVHHPVPATDMRTSCGSIPRVRSRTRRCSSNSPT